MASVRNVKFGDSVLHWHTDAAHILKYSDEEMVAMYKEYVEPAFEGLDVSSKIRKIAYNIVENYLRDHDSMYGFIHLVMALRLTTIEYNRYEESYDVYLRKPYASGDVITFDNIVYHMNRSHKPNNYCFVLYSGPLGNKAISYTTGEADDRKDFFLDSKRKTDDWPKKK